MHDLGDTWLFDLRNNQWTEVPTLPSHPAPRKFAASEDVHFSSMGEGGCERKYEAMGDVHCLDLSSVDGPETV